MTWTYNFSQLQTASLPMVRFLIGDTLATDPLLQDEEINLAIALRGGVEAAAAECCRSISATFARQVDSAVGDLRASFSQKSKAYRELAATLEAKSVLAGTGGLATGISAGGLTQADKAAVEADPDRVPPQFQIGMDDNFLPVSDTGNETLTGGGG